MYVAFSKDVIIPDTIDGMSVKSIDYKTFEGCTSLTNITIPNGVTSKSRPAGRLSIFVS